MLRKVQSSVDPLPSLKNIRSVARESERNRKCIQESDVVSMLTSGIGGVLELRSWFLCKGSLDAKVNAATILAGIASKTESSHSSSIGAMPRVLEALAKLLREEFYPKAIKAGLKALLTICIPRRNRIRVVEVGVVPLLIELLPDAKRSNVELALGVLELLCTTAEGRAAVANHALAMAALVHHLHTVSNLAIELSVAIL
ncbi:unnamed protein product [Sphagnum troendelagicum]